MSGRVLIVDDLAPNVKLLEAKLANEYYDYTSAMSGMEALKKAKEFSPDIILLDVMMPEMDGFEACRRLKADGETAHIPVVMVTALSDISDRVQGLEAGADDFITKPIDDVHLFARVKSLIRIKMMLDELRLRDKTGIEFGLLEQAGVGADIAGAHVLVIDDDVVESKQIQETLSTIGLNTTVTEAESAIGIADDKDFDLAIVSTQLDDEDGLRICMHLRSQDKTRHLPLLILVDEDDRDLMIKGLEMGVNDYIITPLDSNELLARTRTQIKRKRYQDALHSNYEQSLSMAIIDSLTKLYNRRYLDAHLKNIVDEAAAKGTPLSLMTIDIDHFKQVNDKPGWGHHIGDEVLQQVAQRILKNVRSTDLATRPGGEEFVVVMPGTDIHLARHIAERVRSGMENQPFTISAEPGELQCTVSAGLTAMVEGDTAETMLQKSDKALYQAKNNGRNQVVVAD